MNRKLFLFFAACALSAFFLLGCGAVDREDENDEETRVPVEVYTVERGEFVEILDYVGDIRGRRQVDVYPKVGGKLERYEVSEGERVARDGVIALIDRDVTGYDFPPAPVKSPIAGVAARLYPDPGDAVSPQAPVAVVADIGEVVVRISIAEADYPSVREGLAAGVRVDAFPEREFEGKVSRLSRLIDPGSRTAAAEVSVPNLDELLVPGMFARIELVTGAREVLLALRDGVVRRPGTASRYSYVVEDGRVRRRRIRTGASRDEYFEIISGLEEGDRIVVSGHGVLEDGMAVEIAEGL